MRRVALLALVLLASTSGLARANARLVSVTPLQGGCVSGPDGNENSVQQWNVEPGSSYRITITDVYECANGGTAPTLDVRVNSGSAGNIDLVATFVSAGTYQFDVTIPSDARCTMPILYCTSPGESETGIRVYRNDLVEKQSHLRISTFGAGCTNATGTVGADCMVTPTRSVTWGRVKAFYR